MSDPQSTTVLQLKQQQSALATMPDQAVDMFTERGFALANRIAKAFATSTAVPAQFRQFNLKKDGQGGEIWVENDAAIGNCLVAIEVARTVGTSIVSVMQAADIIEGKLRWSGKFQIAAINASGRFTPLRFQMIGRGQLKASYKEKVGWDNAKRKPIMEDRHVEVDNIECIAWALPKGYPEPRPSPEQMQRYQGRMLDLYRDMGLPVVESAPVTMRMVVEEGWYGKSGSKWQTELRQLMFQYRAGSFFGSIHAPDIVMGMGQSSEEARDLAPTTWDVDGDGVVTPTPLAELRPATGPVQMAEVVERTQDAGPAAEPAPPAPSPASAAPADQELQAQPKTAGAAAAPAIGPAPAPDDDGYREAFGDEKPAAPAQAPAPAPTARRARAAGPAVE